MSDGLSRRGFLGAMGAGLAGAALAGAGAATATAPTATGVLTRDKLGSP